MTGYSQPIYDLASFTCPHCSAFAHQAWGQIFLLIDGDEFEVERYKMAECFSCKNYSLWYEQTLVYPSSSTAPRPNPDLPQHVKDDYEEARDIVQRSPRGAAALLLLAIEKLCAELGGGGKDLNACIGSLVARGLDTQVQQMLDSVRVIGNEGVHPGTIDLRDDQETAHALFWLVNEIADELITKPRRIKEVYAKLPVEKRQGIDQRDRRQT